MDINLFTAAKLGAQWTSLGGFTVFFRKCLNALSSGDFIIV
jgi:hypothetical protein